MTKLPELPDYSRDMEIVQALQRLSEAEAGFDEDAEEDEATRVESGRNPEPS
ncbi:hypothetical protein [Alicyclobacillus sp. ALC3]|uniref:hypothetical protein n=1 Tax=Alicyclobacillus sp. ALC3 TaxID=2796143 RepID=UPI0023780019|nr:hypothetical protein [Alicyclobacillus sp. ALC3]WDL97373.1 hypothetical protein JC200_01090 [Alicyclobacillus sp. ALC3]